MPATAKIAPNAQSRKPRMPLPPDSHSYFSATGEFCPSRNRNRRFVMTAFPTPVFNTPDIQFCFGGADGHSLLLDDQNLMRAVETILFPGTRVELMRQAGQSDVWSIKVSAYPYPGEFFIDARFLTRGGTERSVGLPSVNTILKTMR